MKVSINGLGERICEHVNNIKDILNYGNMGKCGGCSYEVRKIFLNLEDLNMFGNILKNAKEEETKGGE